VGGRVVRVVFDSNVWILYLKGEEDAVKLIETVLKNNVDTCVHGLIIEEVWRNIVDSKKKASFIRILLSPNVKIYTWKFPKDMVDKYRKFGLSDGDPVIAAFVEMVRADVLVTEDSDFNVIKNKSSIPFRIMTIVECLEVLK